MADNPIIHKALLNIANMDENYYEEHHLTLAQPPSENDLRLMIRLVAFILNANDTLNFCKGTTQEDEPGLCQKSLNGDIEIWIDLGQPNKKRIKKICTRSKKVIIYTFRENLGSTWFNQMENSLTHFKNLQVVHLHIEGDIELLYKRSMNIQCNILDNELTLIQDDNSVIITQVPLFTSFD